MMKTRQDNNLTDHTGSVYAENRTKLSRPIGHNAVYHENQTGQLYDRSYKCDLSQI